MLVAWSVCMTTRVHVALCSRPMRSHLRRSAVWMLHASRTTSWPSVRACSRSRASRFRWLTVLAWWVRVGSVVASMAWCVRAWSVAHVVLPLPGRPNITCSCMVVASVWLDSLHRTLGETYRLLCCVSCVWVVPSYVSVSDAPALCVFLHQCFGWQLEVGGACHVLAPSAEVAASGPWWCEYANT